MKNLRLLIFLLFAVHFSLFTQRGFAQGALGTGIQYYRNFSAKEYAADNRNADIECDSTGRVYVANFRGLLTYDGVSWHMNYTEGISRVTSLYKAKDGTIWFGGSNVLGSVEWKDSVRLNYVISDKKVDKEFGEVSKIYEDGGRICFTTNFNASFKVEGGKLLPIKNPPVTAEDVEFNGGFYLPETQLYYYASSKRGVVCQDKNHEELYYFDSEDGLCSDMINSIAYDGKGGIWGATNNGIFWMWASEVYTEYTETNGLIGHINTIRDLDGKLFVGTMQGLYVLDEYMFHKLEGIDLACWALDITERKHIIAATTEGVFLYKDYLQQVTTKTALSVFIEDDESFLTGELDGIYRHYYDGREEYLGKVSNVSKMVRGLDGSGVWAISNDGYGKTYYLAKGDKEFKRRDNKKLTLLFSYVDDKNIHWTSRANDKGLACEDLSGGKIPETFMPWLEPFNGMTIQTMHVVNGLAWIGTNEGLVCFDMPRCNKSKLEVPRLYIRQFNRDGKELYVSFSNDKIDPLGTTLYSYRLTGNDRWSKWSEDKDYPLSLAPGDYEFQARSIDAFGQIATSEVVKFNVPYPWYERWYAMLMYVLILCAISYAFYKYRMRKMQLEKDKLEKIVDERTQEVVKQKDEIEAQKDAIVKQKDEIEARKDEIEAKSESLATALSDLKNAQNQLLRQEREATVGKLTKGLIDRILNPMNYINNFSHLTLGLVKDLKGNLEDLQDEIGETENDEIQDLFDDSEDVTGMMTTNLDKIEQHGQAATRILKAMEEMLKERSNNYEPTNIKLICQQNYEMLNNYYAADIKKYGIKVVWEKPEVPIVSDVNAELLSRCIMSMLGNSIYAVKKKAEKNISGYVPEVSLSICPSNGENPPLIVFHDNGIGIEESIIDKVFDPFFTTKPTAEAPGVGLYLCQQIIQDFGGQITVRSEKDVYTEFIIELQ